MIDLFKKMGVVLLVVLTVFVSQILAANEVNSDKVTCLAPDGETIKMPTTKLFFEYNSADGDTGVHGAFDTSSFAELCVYDPNGKQILAVKPQNQLKVLTMAGIFFESREPKHLEVSVTDHFRNFPEGKYTIRGVTFDGKGLIGAATLTHNIPKPVRGLR